jgi:hypothetical protein
MRIEPVNDSNALPFDKQTCRFVINRLRDGLPPPFEAIEFLSVGYQHHLEQAKKGLDIAINGGYSAMIMEGSYGIGKTHLLSLIEIVAKKQRFRVKKVEVGSKEVNSRKVYLNNPNQIYEQILDGEKKPWSYEYIRYAPYYNDYIRKFVAGLKILADRYCSSYGAPGLVILIDELENTFSSYNLPNFRSRAKAYRILDSLFRGGIQAGYQDQGGQQIWQDALKLEYMFVALAITPGTIDQAIEDGPTWGYNTTKNPAEDWQLPTKINISPLGYQQALKLAKRIRAVHSCAFSWNAQEYVTNDTLEQHCKEWSAQVGSRNERELVKSIIYRLEVAEQNR